MLSILDDGEKQIFAIISTDIIIQTIYGLRSFSWFMVNNMCFFFWMGKGLSFTRKFYSVHYHELHYFTRFKKFIMINCIKFNVKSSTSFHLISLQRSWKCLHNIKWQLFKCNARLPSYYYFFSLCAADRMERMSKVMHKPCIMMLVWASHNVFVWMCSVHSVCVYTL